MDEHVKEQKAPVPNERPAVWDLVIADMKARDAHGRAHYGTPLQPFNGRDPLVDAYQEGLDKVVYLKQASDAIAKEAALEEQIVESDGERRYDFGGNQDDAFAAGEHEGRIRGAAEFAVEVLKLL